MNTIYSRTAPIVDLQVEIKLSANHVAEIKAAIGKLEDLSQRSRTVTAAALYQHYKETLRSFAQGNASLDQALALSVLTGTSDAERMKVAEGLHRVLHDEELAVLKAVSPTIIDAFTQRTEALRLKYAAIEASEQENAAACQISFEPSETCQRIQATFRHSLERLRAIRDSGELPSKAELKELSKN